MAFVWDSSKNTWGYSYSVTDHKITTVNDGPRTQSATALPTSAKSYVEVTFDTVVGSDIRVGLSSSTWADYDAGLSEIYTAGSIGLLWGNTGYDFVYLQGNGGSAVNVKSGPWLATDVLRIALDRTVSPPRAWFTIKGADWNGDPTANPATGVGGIDVSFISGNPYVAITHYTGASGGVNTINGGESAFTYTKPSGFAGPAEPVGYTLTAASGSFALTGTAAALKKGSVVAAGSGAFAETGTAASLKKGSLVGASSGSYSLSGTAATLTYTPIGGYTLTAASGAFAETGTAAGLYCGRVVATASGSVVETGTDAGLKAGRTLPAAFAQFTLTGQDATLTKGALTAYTLTALGGAYVWAGGDVTFLGRMWTPIPPTAETWTAVPITAETWVPA